MTLAKKDSTSRYKFYQKTKKIPKFNKKFSFFGKILELLKTLKKRIKIL